MNSLLVENKITGEDELHSKGAYASLLRDCIRTAKKLEASDIHIEPISSGVQIRMRINGDLTKWKYIGQSHRSSFIQEAKRLCQLKIEKADIPQDGRLSLPNMKLDLRVNLLPTLHGEKIVLRLLDYDTRFNLNEIGLLEVDYKKIKESLNCKNGVVLISGPTGSGKTRTLFSMLNHINNQSINLTTLEDPIEYQFKGMNQVQVSPRVSFGDALRAVLRQDPDVIMLGEIRDEESAQLCFKAAATGHLVLSTLHSNSAAQVISRLNNLGINEVSIKDNLRISIAQRLVKKLCKKCSIVSVGAKERVTNPEGCSDCRQGIAGRLPLVEWIDFKELSNSFEESRKPIPNQSLIENCLSRIAAGEVDKKEVAHFE